MDRSNNTKESDQFNGEKNDYSINESSEDVPFLFQRDYGSTECMNNKKDDLAQVLAQQGNHHALDRLMLSCLRKGTKPKVKKKTVQNVTPLLYIPSEKNPSIVTIDKNMFYDLMDSKKLSMMNNGQKVGNPRNMKQNTNSLLQETSNLNTNIIKEVPVDVLTKKRNKSSPMEIVECNVCKLKFESRSRLSHHMRVHRRCINTGVRRCRKMANQTNASLIAKIIQENNMYSLRESPNSLNTCRSNNIDRFQDERKLSVISSSSDLRLQDERKLSVISSSSDLRLRDKRKHSVISSSSDFRLQDKRKHSIISSSSDPILLPSSFTVLASVNSSSCNIEDILSKIVGIPSLKKANTTCTYTVLSPKTASHVKDYVNGSNKYSTSSCINKSSSQSKVEKHVYESGTADFKALPIFCQKTKSAMHIESPLLDLDSRDTYPQDVHQNLISSYKNSNTRGKHINCIVNIDCFNTGNHDDTMEHMNTLSDTASNDDPGTQYNNLEQMNTLFETASINYTGNHDDTLEQMNTLSETASNNDTGNHDDTLEQMNTLSETALNNDTGNHDDTLEQMNTLSETALNNDTGNHDDTLEQMNTLSETALNNDTGNHDDTLEQMNTLSETALNNDTGNHDDTLEQMNTLSETALNNNTGNHDDTLEQMNTLSETASSDDTGNNDEILEQMNTLSETALKDHMTGNCISNGTREINQNVLSAEQNINLSIVKDYEANSCCNSDENKRGRNTLLDNYVITIEDIRKDNSVNKDGHINSRAKKTKHRIDNAITVNNKVDHGNRNIKNCKESCFIASEIEDNKKKHDTKRKSLRGNKKKEESKTSISQNNNNKIKHDKRKRCGNEIITPIDWPGYNSVMDSFNTEVYLGSTSLENLYPSIQDLEKNALGVLQKLSSQKIPCTGGNPCTQNIPCKRESPCTEKSPWNGGKPWTQKIPCKRRNLCTQESSCKEENQSGQKSPCKRNHSEKKLAQKGDNQISQAISYIGDMNSMQTCPNKESMCNSLMSSCGDNFSTSKIDTDTTISCMQDMASPCTNMNNSVKQMEHFYKNDQFQVEDESIRTIQKSIEQFNKIDSKEQMEAHPFMVIKSFLDDIACCGIPLECHGKRDINNGSKILDENCTRTSCYHDNMRHYKMRKERISYLGTDNVILNKKGNHVCDSDKHVCDTDKHVSDSGKHVCDTDKYTCDSDIHFSDANNHKICDRDTCFRNSVDNDSNVDHSKFEDKEQIDISDNHVESSESKGTCSTGKNSVCDNESTDTGRTGKNSVCDYESKDTGRTGKNSVCDYESKDTGRTGKNFVCDKEVVTTEGCDLKHPREDNLTIKTGDDKKLCYSETVIFIDGTVKERPRINKPERFKKHRSSNNVLDDDCIILHEVTSSSTYSHSLSPIIDYVEQSSPESLKTVSKLQYIKLMDSTGSKERGGNQRKLHDVKNLFDKFSCSNDKKTEYNIYGQIMKSDLSVLSMEHFKCHKDDENMEHIKWQNKKSCVDKCNSDGGTTLSRAGTCFSDDKYSVVRLKNKGRKKKHISKTVADQYIEMKEKCSVQYKDKIKETRKRKANLLFTECSSKKCIKSCNVDRNGYKDESNKKKKEENINTLNMCNRKDRTNTNRNSEDVLSEKSKITKKVEKNRFLNRKSARICQKKNVIRLDRVCKKSPRKTGKLEPLKDIVWQNQKKGQNSLKYTKSSEKDISQGSKISRKSQCPAKCKKLVKKEFFVKSQKKKKESHSISHQSPGKCYMYATQKSKETIIYM